MTTSTLAGKSVVLTGKLDQLGMLREEAIRALNSRGAYVQDAVDDGTDFLVQGRPPGRETVKARRARALGIPVIDQRDFGELLDRADILGDTREQERRAYDTVWVSETEHLRVQVAPLDKGLGDILADLAARERREEREW